MIDASTMDSLGALLGERMSTAPAVLEQHANGEAYHSPAPPDVVAFASSTEEVAEIVRVCARTRTPIVPFGSGTSLEGQVNAIHGGVCLDLSRMRSIIAVDVDDLDVTVQAGVTRTQLEGRLRREGLFFPVDPGADATLGGMAATRASGTTTVRYGSMRDNVLSLTVVLADGSVIKTASRARKSAAGYDLTRLFVGSEGTLGIITELTLRVYGVPEAIVAAVASFPSVRAAVDVTIEIMQLGVGVARIELLDEVMVAAVNQYSGRDHTVAPTLFFEFHGSEAQVAEQVSIVAARASAHGATELASAETPGDRERLWEARHQAYYAALALRHGSSALTGDACVPISRLAECIDAAQAQVRASSLTAPIVGHVGDGNFHVAFLIDPDDAAEVAEAQAVNERIVRHAIALGGTCSGEHGVGLGKRHLLETELGGAVDVMSKIKAALDPDHLLNPGKILETGGPSTSRRD